MAIKTCQICNKTFECKVNHIEDCFCRSIQLSTETKEFLSLKNDDCLCKECLMKIETKVKSHY